MDNNTALTSSLSFLAPIGLIVFALACSGEKEPFDIHARAMTRAPKRISVDATPTSTALIAAAEANSVAHGQAQAVSLFAPTKGTIRIGQRSDKPNQFVNALAGHILVYGYDWTVELVAIEGHSYRDAFGAAEIDVLLDLDRAPGGDWYDNTTESGVLADVGSITDSRDDSRIVVRGGLTESATEVVEFLNLVKPTDDLLAKL